ncbi:MAG: hypothetical protein ACK559_23085 [bacterium]
MLHHSKDERNYRAHPHLRVRVTKHGHGQDLDLCAGTVLVVHGHQLHLTQDGQTAH